MACLLPATPLTLPLSPPPQVGIERAELDDIWAKSDFITVHTPLTKETKNLIDDATIAKCKEGVRIVNCARGAYFCFDPVLILVPYSILFFSLPASGRAATSLSLLMHHVLFV
jgi:D-isomer specific 2-hydroxyacid dehydrogenase, NAD binding domain